MPSKVNCRYACMRNSRVSQGRILGDLRLSLPHLFLVTSSLRGLECIGQRSLHKANLGRARKTQSARKEQKHSHATDMAKSWLEVPAASHFSLANIPFGVISTALEDLPRPAVAIGEYALDLKVFSENRGFDGLPSMHGHLSVFCESTLNAFAALGRPIHRQVRGYLQRVFAADTEFPEVLKENTELRRNSLIPLAQANNHLPLRIGDYTDFFVGKNHAYNCGVLFRGAANALQPNYMHLPVGYHGRASSIVGSLLPRS